MNGIRNNAHSSLPYQNRLYNLQYEITFVSYLLRIQNSNINTSGLKCLATLILFFGNVLLRQSIDLDSRSRQLSALAPRLVPLLSFFRSEFSSEQIQLNEGLIFLTIHLLR